MHFFMTSQFCKWSRVVSLLQKALWGWVANTRTCTHMHTHPFYSSLDFVGITRVSQYQKGYWSKRQWVAMASAGPHANLHFAPDM